MSEPSVPSIRDALSGDRPALLAFVVAIQEAERALHASRLPGAEVGEGYLERLLAQVEVASGCVLVAEAAGAAVGFTAGWLAESTDTLQSPAYRRHGYIADICVAPEWRGRGVAQRLLAAVEARLAAAGARRLKICSLATNRPAIAAYRRFGFRPFEVELEKDVG